MFDITKLAEAVCEQRAVNKVFREVIDAYHKLYCRGGCVAECWQEANEDFAREGLMEDALPPNALERARDILAKADALFDYRDWRDTMDSVRPGGM